MSDVARRQIIKIDESKCTGCGDCITACAEGALRIVDDKARLVSDVYCDGLGACLGDCPEGAISIEEREAEAFDEEAVRNHLAALWTQGQDGNTTVGVPASCPSSQVVEIGGAGNGAAPAGTGLTHWPIKLQLVPPDAPFLQGAELMLVADCVGFAWGDLRRQLSSERAVVIGCPKFDDHGSTRGRLTEILQRADVRRLTVVHMEVPCCTGYWHVAREACAAAGTDIPLDQIVIDARGEVKEMPSASG